MQHPHISDALFYALLFRDKEALATIAAERPEEMIHLRAIMCTQAPGAIDLDLGLGLVANDHIISFFEGPRAYFMSAGGCLQAHLTGGRNNVLLDYSLSFDSNFAEKMRAVIAGENIQKIERDRVIEILMLKARNSNVQFDVQPFLVENIRLSRDNPDNQRPLNTLIAFRMLDHLDWKIFRESPGTFVFDKPADALRAHILDGAKAFLKEMYNDEHIARQEAKSAFIQALLLRFARLWHQDKKRDHKQILRELLIYSVRRLGAIPLTELLLIWSGMSSTSGAPFFGPITGKSGEMLKKIRGMAWDMTLLRLLERTATITRNGSFFIPYFVSIDRRWRDLLRLNPVNMMIVDDRSHRMQIARTDELNFRSIFNECLQGELRSDMTPEKIEQRRLAAIAPDLEVMRARVAEEEAYWVGRL
ncbi:hypothetical protein [Pantoea cypripedii]|uniref:Uncharacterized protein n=1 Tax=Pantoea cypripedii TaxID=55209 RepID=A0A1X1EL29_PANCY|nr:hypothetical protein [Pantoea cypripedii]MBP2199077.1 hypothetical protein [Pantoea cypripedii]ORM89484.1 hypothetical protein HA50_22925 [Pantoea cypripedii]